MQWYSEDDQAYAETLFVDRSVKVQDLPDYFPTGELDEDNEPVLKYSYDQLRRARNKFLKDHGYEHDTRGRKPDSTPGAPKRQHGAPTLEAALLAAAMKPGPLQVIPDTVTKIEITLKWDEDQLDHIEKILVNLLNG